MATPGKAAESLLDRSQRILGISLDEGEKSKPRTRKSNLSPGRRREQVGQAQRTHRQRTQRYIRELENEVLRLRNLEKASRKRNKLLEDHRSLLIQSLTAHNLAVPETPASILSPLSPDYDDGAFSDGDRASTLVSVDITGLGTISPHWACSDDAAERIPTDVDYSMLTPAQNFDEAPNSDPEINGSDLNGATSRQLSLANLDAQAGVDFILALEHPCLSHVKFALENNLDYINPNFRSHSGPAHVFTATASLLSATTAEEATSHPFSMPQNEIDRLLDASKRLNLEHELTPVQVWQKIQEIAAQQHISQPLLDALKADCSKFSFCNSFGSVLDKSAVEIILSYHFPQLAL